MDMLLSSEYRLKVEFPKNLIDVVLHVGENYVIPGNMPYSFEKLQGGEVIDVFTPKREVYFKKSEKQNSLSSISPASKDCNNPADSDLRYSFSIHNALLRPHTPQVERIRLSAATQ
ncbi:hypothetical protein [Alistipes ihumii]|uniref:hypothetical protein n=1 Tax=Alistipes ihumii TaxID=1470347 RepID=UPI0026DD6BED|nr:hypothetical protein [Alistipes ihumii]